MQIRIGLLICALALVLAGCSQNQPAPTNGSTTANKATPTPDGPGPLSNEGFKAELSLVDPPAKLRISQPVVVQVKVKNTSPVTWWARGGPVNTRPDNKFYIAAGNRWLKADGTLLTNMDGRYGISKDLKPGEENDVPLKVTAPKDPGEYILEVDLVQEGVAWFSDKGSPTAKAKVTVVK